MRSLLQNGNQNKYSEHMIYRSAVTKQWLDSHKLKHTIESFGGKRTRGFRGTQFAAPTSSGVPRRAPSKVSARKLKISLFKVLFYKVSLPSFRYV